MNALKRAIMQNKDYLLPGIAALVLAIIFPLYWFSQIVSGSVVEPAAIMANINSLSFSDGVFLVIDLLGIYVYLNFRKILNDQLNFKSVDLLLMLVVGVHVIFLATLGLDLMAALLSEQLVLRYEDTFVDVHLITTIGTVILLGLLDFLIGAVLLMNSENMPTLLKIFALVTLLQGLLGVSVIFSFVSVLSFPLSLILLSGYFLRKPESVEVV